ncbi:hypothetical protein GPALN_004827 [Globodera pallida]|nr:hypothetical protein GPALN_004827 [Globodera pallida]
MEQQLQLIMIQTNKQLLNHHDLTEQEKELVLEAKNILTSVKKVVVYVRNHNWLRKNMETLLSDEVETSSVHVLVDLVVVRLIMILGAIARHFVLITGRYLWPFCF